MSDNKVSNECQKILNIIENNNQNIKNIIDKKNKEIEELKKSLDISESGRQTAESMVTQIKEEVNIELKKAYTNGYNAALFNANPTGGTTISQEDTKKLVLNQN